MIKDADNTSKLPLVLAIDIGTGTQDIFLSGYSSDVENCPQIIAPSPTKIFARKIDGLAEHGKNIFLSGYTMGGGPVNMAIKRALKSGLKVYGTERAARTIDDDLDVVRATGVEIADEAPPDAFEVRLTDIMIDNIHHSFSALGVELPGFELAVAVQDHGQAPKDMSDRKFRFEHLKKTAEEGKLLSSFYTKDDIPPYLTRMRSVLDSSPVETLVTDTGIAAILGALEDEKVASFDNRVIINAGNGHTLAVSMSGEEVIGMFEHHTSLVTPDKMAYFLNRLIDGTLTNDEVFNDGGHGAFILGGIKEPVIAVTGPKRSLLSGLPFKLYFAVPYGDMMLSGCFGLVRAHKKRRGNLPI